MITEKWTYHDNEEIEIHPVGDEDVGDHTIAILCEDGYYNREIALEHARLIAAAPDLLAACKAQAECAKASSECEGCNREKVCHGEMLPNFLIAAAIAKATN